jgi:ubiquinone biosynthesis protein
MKGLRRLGVIAGVLARHGFGDIVDRIVTRREEKPRDAGDKDAITLPGLPSPARLRMILEELGPSFIKLGQLMSTRADIFPPEYIDELIKLQDSVTPVPVADIRAVVERELRHKVAKIFAAFDEAPLAAASVAQVHVAKLFTGEKVAVKVIRPGIAKKIREDISLMYYMADRIERAFEISRMLGLTNIVREFERTIFRELDMYIEAGNIEKFGANFKKDEEIRIPAVHWEYTSKSVLVMEFIDGVKMDEVEKIRAMGIDPKEIALIGLRSFSRQLMEFGFFHADPHPGNTIVMRDGRVGLVDFGITGYLDDETMRHIANIFLGYAEHDYDMVMDALLGAGLIHEEGMDLAEFRTDLKDMSESFYGRSLQYISVVDVYDQIIQLVLKHRVRLPRNLLLLLKTFIQTEALGKILGSDASLLEITRPYAKRLLERSYDPRKLFMGLDREARAMGAHMKSMPKLVHDILKRTAAGKQRVELRHSGFERLDERIEKGANRLTVGMVISASLLAAALVLNASGNTSLPALVLGSTPVSIGALLGLAGYVIATILGAWLIISIHRSGKM